MKFEYYIARKISFSKENKKKMSYTVIRIAGSAVAVGIAVMIISVAVVTGFKNEIYKKVVGFQSHITVKNRDVNGTYETLPIENNAEFKKYLSKTKGVKHVQVFATKPGIIKADDEVQGVVLKGISSDFDWQFLNKAIISGKKIDINSKTSDKILISSKLAKLLGYKTGDKVNVFFINEKPKARRFIIEGIYETGIDEFDKAFIFCDIKQIVKINNWKENQISGYEIFLNKFNDIQTSGDEIRDQTAVMISDDGTMMQVSDFNQNNEMLVEWLKLSDTNVIVILTLMIIVAVLTMISALLTIILERTNMIGILKTAGAKDFKIMKIFVVNGSIIIVKAMIIGNLTAFASLFIQKYYKIIPLNPEVYYLDSVPTEINFSRILLLNIVAILVSSAALLIPALLVSKINPSETVKFK